MIPFLYRPGQHNNSTTVRAVPGAEQTKGDTKKSQMQSFNELDAELLLAPPPSRATRATPTGDTGGVNSGACGRSHHGRGGSTAYCQRGNANRGSNASRVALHRTHSWEPCWHDDGRVVVGGSDSGSDSISRNCCGDETDGSIGRGSKYSAGIWIRDTDSGCNGSEREDSASEVDNDHDGFAFWLGLLGDWILFSVDKFNV